MFRWEFIKERFLEKKRKKTRFRSRKKARFKKKKENTTNKKVRNQDLDQDKKKVLGSYFCSYKFQVSNKKVANIQ